MSRLMELLLKVCLLSTTSQCVWAKQIAPNTQLQSTETTTELYAEALHENVVEVTKDEWTQIDHASTLDDLNRILGIVPEAYPENSAFRQSSPFEEGLLRKASTDRYIGNPDLTVCITETRVVDLDLPPTVGVEYYPKCVKLQRCGGCCVDSSRECKPTESRKVHVKVMQLTTLDVLTQNAALRRRGERRNKRRRREKDSIQYESFNMTLTEHMQCGCQCKILETDCDPINQEHDPMSCVCKCLNKDKRDKCMNDHLRYWSEHHCDCKCREGNTAQCSTGKVFNQQTCQCERSPSTSNFDYLLRRTQDQLHKGLSLFSKDPNWKTLNTNVKLQTSIHA